MININNLTKKYEDHTIFNNFSLEINDNMLIAIMGKSGCGKSTLLNILGLLDTDYTGEIICNGTKYSTLKEKERMQFIRNNLNYLFQNFALIDNESVEYNLLLALEYEKIDKQKKIQMINEVLKNLNLEGFNKKKVYSLSGGEQQRISLARSIIKRGNIILADEPTGNLDKENSKMILSILNNLKKEKTIIIVTHDEDIANKCDLIIKLQ